MSNDKPRKLSDILAGKSFEELARRFDEIEAAPDFVPVPEGKYEVDLVSGEMYESQNGSKGYKCVFEVSTGDHRGRRIWHTFWLSESSMPFTKRDLQKLGINSLKRCAEPAPAGIYCTVKVKVRTDNDGTQWNRVAEIVAGGVRNDPTADPDFPLPPANG